MAQALKAIAQLDYISSATIHFAKCAQPYFAGCWDGLKTSELRFNDRGYRVGDFMILEEYEVADHTYSGRWLAYGLTHMTTNETFGRGLEPGWCVLSLYYLTRSQSAKPVRRGHE